MSIWSPCVKVCFVDPSKEICVGCFRRLSELGRWTKMTDEERAEIGRELPARRAAYERERAESK